MSDGLRIFAANFKKRLYRIRKVEDVDWQKQCSRINFLVGIDTLGLPIVSLCPIEGGLIVSGQERDRDREQKPLDRRPEERKPDVRRETPAKDYPQERIIRESTDWDRPRPPSKKN